MIYEANNLEVNYEVVKPEELSPKERAMNIFNKYFCKQWMVYEGRIQKYRDIPRDVSLDFAKKEVEQILRLPLIGSGRMQPENLSDLKYWKDVLSELEKM